MRNCSKQTRIQFGWSHSEVNISFCDSSLKCWRRPSLNSNVTGSWYWIRRTCAFWDNCAYGTCWLKRRFEIFGCFTFRKPYNIYKTSKVDWDFWIQHAANPSNNKRYILYESVFTSLKLWQVDASPGSGFFGVLVANYNETSNSSCWDDKETTNRWIKRPKLKVSEVR